MTGFERGMAGKFKAAFEALNAFNKKPLPEI